MLLSVVAIACRTAIEFSPEMSDTLPKPGDRVSFSLDESRIHLFDAGTGLTLRRSGVDTESPTAGQLM